MITLGTVFLLAVLAFGFALGARRGMRGAAAVYQPPRRSRLEAVPQGAQSEELLAAAGRCLSRARHGGPQKWRGMQLLYAAGTFYLGGQPIGNGSPARAALVSAAVVEPRRQEVARGA